MHLRDFSPPATPAAAAAWTVAQERHTVPLLHHVVRSWLWAEAFAIVDGHAAYDAELVYVAAILHDIGLVTEFDNATLAYEDAGGHVAAAVTAGAGWSPERRARVHDVIVRHNWPSVDPAFDVEGHLLETATALDISGSRPDALPATFVDEVLDAYPRLALADEFGASVRDQAHRKPSTAAHRLVRSGVVERLRTNPLERRR